MIMLLSQNKPCLHFRTFTQIVNQYSRLNYLCKCSKWRLSKKRRLVADDCLTCACPVDMLSCFVVACNNVTRTIASDPSDGLRRTRPGTTPFHTAWYDALFNTAWYEYDALFNTIWYDALFNTTWYDALSHGLVRRPFNKTWHARACCICVCVAFDAM